jgi:hypothetical protein
VLVSQEGDMLWGATITPGMVQKCGRAGWRECYAAFGRYAFELKLPESGWRKAVPEGERDLELLTALAEDDGINFHPPLAGERGTVEIRQDARDNADWDEFPCDWKRLDNGWSVPIVTAEIRAAVRRALENRLDYVALGWMPLPPAPGRGA